MKILCLQHQNGNSHIFLNLIDKLREAASLNNHILDENELEPGDLFYCFGCMRCWSSGTDVCVNKDKLYYIEEKMNDYGLIVFISPVIYGTFSPVIKIPIEKGLGNKLHHDKLYPQVIIGYGDDITDEEKSTFIDITKKHCGPAEVVHPELKDLKIDVFVSRSIDDNEKIAKSFINLYPENFIL